MCDPVSMAVVSAGISAASISAQNKSLTQQQNAINSAARMNYNMEQQKQADIASKAGMDLTAEALKRQAERGRIRVAQSESGVTGASPLRELANSYLQQSFTAGSIVSKEEADIYSSSMKNVSTYLDTKNQINTLQANKTTGLAALTQVAIAGAGGYMAGGGTFGGTPTTFTTAGGQTISSAGMSASQLATANSAVASGAWKIATPGVAGFGSRTLGASLMLGSFSSK